MSRCTSHGQLCPHAFTAWLHKQQQRLLWSTWRHTCLHSKPCPLPELLTGTPGRSTLALLRVVLHVGAAMDTAPPCSYNGHTLDKGSRWAPLQAQARACSRSRASGGACGSTSGRWSGGAARRRCTAASTAVRALLLDVCRVCMNTGALSRPLQAVLRCPRLHMSCIA